MTCDDVVADWACVTQAAAQWRARHARHRSRCNLLCSTARSDLPAAYLSAQVEVCKDAGYPLKFHFDYGASTPVPRRRDDARCRPC